MENDTNEGSFNETQPGDYRDNAETLFTPHYNDEAFHSILLASFIANAVISLCGIVANIINIVVFIHQGFRETINISLTALAMSDLASLVFFFWICICHFPAFGNFVRSKFNAFEISYFTGGIPRSFFTMVGGWITAIIAVERCVCVIRPLEAKFLLTKFRLLATLAVAMLLAMVPVFILYYTTRLRPKLDAETNTTFLGLAFSSDRAELDVFSSTIAVVMTTTTFGIVCVCTAVINVTIAKQMKWRTGSTMATSSNPTNDKAGAGTGKDEKSKKSHLSSRDARATRTVTLIATIFIVCYFPSTVNRLTMSFISEYSKSGRYGNLWELCWSLSFMAEAISSGANIFVYSTTSTKFEATLKGLLRCRIDNKAEETRSSSFGTTRD